MKVISIKSSSQIQQLKKSKDKKSGKFFLLIRSISSATDQINYLLIVTKKIGKAVARNKIRRRLKSIIFKHSTKMDPRFNYLFIAKRQIADCTFEDLQTDFVKWVENN